MAKPQPPSADDPLATLAHAAQRAVSAADRAREDALEEQRAGAASRKRLVRALSYVVSGVVVVGSLFIIGSSLNDPYFAEDPFGDPRRARAYVAGLLEEVAAYRARNGGQLPRSLEQVVSESRLPARGSAYRLEYRIDGDTPVLTLQGGAEPVVVRGSSK